MSVFIDYISNYILYSVNICNMYYIYMHVIFNVFIFHNIYDYFKIT